MSSTTRSILRFAIFAVVLAAHLSASAQVCDPWQWVRPRPQGNTLHGVASNGEVAIAVGDNGVVVRTVDGSSWEIVRSGATDDLLAIVHGNGRFVAVGSNGTILYSDDGASWFAAAAAKTELRGVTWTGEKFVAVGSAGVVVASLDGQQWNTIDVGSNAELNAVAATSDRIFIAGNGVLLTSTSMRAWTVFTIAHHPRMTALAVGDDRVVAVGLGAVLSNRDGNRWIQHPTGIPYYLRSVHWTGDRFIALGNAHATYYSLDGATWKRSELRASERQIFGIGTHGETLIAVGERGTILTSNNGLEWSLASLELPGSAVEVEWLDGRWLATGWNGLLTVSLDGNTWQTINSGTDRPISSIATNGSATVVVGGLLYNDGLILHSEDLTSWSPVHDIVLPPMYKVTWTGDQFVALGDLGYLLTSPDGLQWTRHGTGTELWLHGAASGNGTLVVVGERGLILIGSDGTDFNQLELITPSSLHDVIWNGEVFVAGGRDGTILRSRNGLDWTVGDSGFEGTIHDLLWTGESFIAATSTTLLTSRDAITWAPLGEPPDESYGGVAWNGNQYLAVGSEGAMFRSLCLDRVGIDLTGATTATVQGMSTAP